MDKEVSIVIGETLAKGKRYDRLILYARKLLSGFQDLEVDPEDVVHTAIMKTIAGVRPWNAKEVDLFSHLSGCVKSIVSNEHTSLGHKSIDKNFDMHQELKDYHDHLEVRPDQIVNRENMVDFAMKYVSVVRPDLVPIAQLIYIDGIEKPQDLSEIMNLPVKVINTQKLALRRIFSSKKIRETLAI